MRRVAITGIGAVTPLGNDAVSTWDGLRHGRSGVSMLDTFDASTFPVRIAGQVRNFLSPQDIPAGHDDLSRAALFGLAAAAEALSDAGSGWRDGDPYRRGVAVAATVGRPELAELVDAAHLVNSTNGAQLPRQAPRDVALRDQNAGAAAIAAVGACAGPCLSLSTACAGSAHALGEAYRLVQEGDCDLVVAGGFDALTTWMDVLGFSLLGAVTSAHNDDPASGSRPFDARRSGFVLGEGAVMAVLEDWDTALARGARIHAELVGYGSSLNAYRITDSPPDGGGASSAMQAALDESGLTPSDVDCVVAHGTGTQGNDLSETVALKAVFGSHASELSVTAPKSMTGHLTSAAAGVNLVAALGALRDSVVPPTVNLDHPDPLLDLDYTPLVARSRPVRVAMVNAFAFGGTNASFLVRQADGGQW